MVPELQSQYHCVASTLSQITKLFHCTSDDSHNTSDHHVVSTVPHITTMLSLYLRSPCCSHCTSYPHVAPPTASCYSHFYLRSHCSKLIPQTTKMPSIIPQITILPQCTFPTILKILMLLPLCLVSLPCSQVPQFTILLVMYLKYLCCSHFYLRTPQCSNITSDYHVAHNCTSDNHVVPILSQIPMLLPSYLKSLNYFHHVAPAEPQMTETSVLHLRYLTVPRQANLSYSTVVHSFIYSDDCPS